MKTWINYNKRIYTSNQQLIFLLRCRRYDLMPSHINNLRFNIAFHSNNVKRKFNNIIRFNQQKLLKLEIKDLNFNLNFLKSKMKLVEESLLNQLPNDLVYRFFKLSEQRLKHFNNVKKNNVIKKFNHLKRKFNFESDPFKDVDNSKC